MSRIDNSFLGFNSIYNVLVKCISCSGLDKQEKNQYYCIPKNKIIEDFESNAFCAFYFSVSDIINLNQAKHERDKNLE